MSGGESRNRTGVDGFAIRCITSPRTKPKLTSVMELEALLDVEGLVARAVEGTQTEIIGADYGKLSSPDFSHLL